MITIQTSIEAPPELCFDLSRDLDLHVRSMAHTGEKAIGGRTSGLLEKGEEVTWQGRHFGIVLRHTSRITQFERPRHFRDFMTQGHFAKFEHDHYFDRIESGTLMRDVVDFESPFGLAGRLVDRLFLKGYLERLLTARALAIKGEAERS
ncbi:MAG TPA: SRPBCC family protein [Candidatus Polarisedimenticolaceae bacterium]|nr:SRPBCC family protein [Candidatus Polarisedimenticolaceae bacterium]